MKILIVYYSKTGMTEKVAVAIKKEFEARQHKVDVVRVKPVKEHSFWSWFFIRLFRGECDIQPPKIQDVSEYDLVCIGTPNWTRLSLPVARYLRQVKGLKYKNIGFFATTTLLPNIEWYILSMYLLDLTVSRIIERKGGRIIASVILSSFFKRWNFASEYGKRAIKNFCDKLEAPIKSLKDYFLKQKEIESIRFLVILFSIFLLLSFLGQIISSITANQVLTWSEYLFLFVIGFFSYFSLLTILEGKTWVFWGKYLVGITLPILLTLTSLFLAFGQGKPIILGYILIFILISFFRDPKAVIFTGAVTILSYGYVFFNYQFKEVFQPTLDIPFLLLGMGMISFITQKLQKHYINSLEAQDEIEAARKKAEEEKDKTLTIITNFADGLLVFDFENKLVRVNPQAEKFFNTKNQRVIGKTMPELASLSKFKFLAGLFGKGKWIKKVFRKELKLKENLTLEVSTVPMASGEAGKLGSLVILHDITREKRIERMKTEFVSLAAHQLKGPLSGIKWTLRMFLDDELGKVTPKQKNFLEKTYQANERMIALINDLLNVARIEEGRYVYKPVPTDLESMIQSRIDFLQEEIKRKKLKFEFKKPVTKLPQVAIDAEKIDLVIQNLLENAIRYTPTGKEVTVSLKGGIKEIEVTVADTGIGIPQYQQKRVFTKFFRGANAMRMATEGTGLGLFITKNIIEAHKGKIWFESEKNKGTTFHFTLPVKK